MAKSGAEGLLCFGLPESGLGVAIRVLDGSYRSHTVIAARVLEELDAVPETAITEFFAATTSACSTTTAVTLGITRLCFPFATRPS